LPNYDEPLLIRLASAVSVLFDCCYALCLLISVTGTNAHCIIDDAGSYLRSRQLHGHALEANLAQNLRITNGASDAAVVTTVPRLFVLSANDEHSMKSLASSYGAYLGSLTPTDETLYLEQLAYTLQSRRSLLPWREAVVASDLKELSEKLLSQDIVPCRNSGLGTPRLGFVFTGQGAQWSGMGYELMETYQVYKDTIIAADKHLQSLGSKWSLLGKFLIPELI
jgi:acyl transferase domain-containing protein